MKTCENVEVPMEYVKPAPLNQRLILLTKDNRYEVGPWKGAPMPDNKTYKAWAAVPARDVQLEKQLGYQ